MGLLAPSVLVCTSVHPRVISPVSGYATHHSMRCAVSAGELFGQGGKGKDKVSPSFECGQFYYLFMQGPELGKQDTMGGERSPGAVPVSVDLDGARGTCYGKDH